MTHLQTNTQPSEYMIRLVNGQTASYKGRAPADLNDKYQRGTHAECKALVKQEHSKPEGLRITGLLGFNADGSTTDMPFPDGWLVAPSDVPLSQTPFSQPATEASIEPRTGDGAQDGCVPGYECEPQDVAPAIAKFTSYIPDPLAVTNTQFLQGIFGSLAPGKTCWTTSFAANPKPAKGEAGAEGKDWKGNKCQPEEVQDTPFGNAYISVSSFRMGSDRTFKRDREHFDTLYMVVLDDIKYASITPTWKLETSLKNFQLGFKLKEPINDLDVASRLHEEITKADLGNDKSGNMAVRYVRLPGGCNTKAQPTFPCRLHSFDPTITYTLEQLIDAFRLDRAYIMDGDKPQRSKQSIGRSVGSTDNDYLAPDQPDADQVEDLRSALAHLDSDDRTTWVNCMMALRTCIDGYSLWIEYSGKSSKFDPAKEPHQWGSARPTMTHWKQIFVMARAKGWPGRDSRTSGGAVIAAGLLSRPLYRDLREATGSAKDVADTNTHLPPAIDPAIDPTHTTTLFDSPVVLPPFAKELLNLPYGLGEIQRYIYGRMKYPSSANAGVTAISCFQSLAMGIFTIESFSGLGLNEYYFTCAPTGFGKEDLRQSIEEIFNTSKMDCLINLTLPTIQFALPASAQGAHAQLLGNPQQLFMADELAEYMAGTQKDQHKQGLIGYIMECYTRPLKSVNVPYSLTSKQPPVKHPRVAIYATTTWERMSEVMTSSHATSGVYNRVVIHIGEQTRIEKKYNGLVYEIPETVKSLVKWLTTKPPNSTIIFSPEAWDYFVTYDKSICESLKFSDNALAGRLSEQAIKMAAVIALSDLRTVITVEDMTTAFAIRLGMYHRAAAIIGRDQTMSDLVPTGKAVAQVTEVFKRKESLSISRMRDFSRAFKSLSANDQASVIRMLVMQGTCRLREASTVYDSLIYEI